MPARSVLLSTSAPSKTQAVFVRDLANLYKGPCGSCHQGLLENSNPPKNWYALDHRYDILARMTSDDPDFVMPPYAQFRKTWSQRLSSGDDPIVKLERLLEAWYAAADQDTGQPPLDVFDVSSDDMGARSGTSAYAPLDSQVAGALTSIGNCLPDKRSVASDRTTMTELDRRFEQATQLPVSLDETDLVSLDSAVLARTGVVAFAPAYTLYSDGARKLRHVRVPAGQSIRFDRDSQRFVIPAHTRFYKTFFKKVTEVDGSERYRKLETRLIVSRPDGPDASEGSHETHSLYGTYVWDEAERSAQLVRDPLRNGQPFGDRLITYVTDEAKAHVVFADRNRHDKEQALFEAGAARTYAVPGSRRCEQCHQGSPGQSFVLGFTPLQIKRRVNDQGGTYEATSADELTQLQRLLDYGVIGGLASVDDILPLEKSQGDRAPRNNAELKAQAYMLGNCAGCHNPRGYPSVQYPVLRDLLSFLPNPNGGGIFQFPLERVSPRIKRGPNQDIDIPYITPSLLELEDQVALASGLNGEPGSGQVVPSVVLGYGESNTDTSFYVAAPWRSLIYRNVDAPFTFAQDYALYPHMPMNAPGFDIRAPRLFAEWMLSIPARLSPGLTPGVERSATAQVYAEVKPGESDYATASDEARVRLDLYRNGGKSTFDYFADQATTTSHSTQFLNYRYASYAPDDRDIIDHGLALPGADHTPRDLSGLPSEYAQQAAACAAISSPSCTAALSPDGVPDRPHWVVTDITDVPPPWSPRRTDWADVLVHHNPDALNSPEPQREQQLALDLLGSMTLTASLRSFLETSIPFGLWKDNPGCDWGAHSVRKVSEYPAAEQWSWMQAQGVSADARVYTQTFGEAVFGEICINCHGPKFDSRGLQSDNLLLITGGETRVANLRDGLFGPANKPGNYRAPIFGPYATNEVSTNDWAARYTAWMALGGTKAKIDPVILRLVGNALVLGAKRPSTATGDAQDANMLSNARALCNQTEGRLRGRALPFNAASGRLDTSGVALGLIESNGDAELWRRLCAFENTRPIYVLSPVHTDSADYLQPRGYHFPAGWPAEALLGDQLGSQQALASTNHFPWCVNAPKTADETTALNAIVQDKRGGRSLPLCASTWLQKPMTDSDLDRWATRGAINAGFAVFLHLDARARRALAGQVEQPPYDRCEDWTN